MNIFDYKNSFENLLANINDYTNIATPYCQQAIVNYSRVNDILDTIVKMTSSVLEPANAWENLLNEAQYNLEENDIISCHTNFTGIQASIADSISNISMQISIINDTSEEFENSLDIVNQEHQSTPTAIDIETYTNLKEIIENIFETLNDFSRFSEIIKSDIQEINDTLNTGLNPYDYEMYNSTTVLKMQIITSYSDIQLLRADFFG